MDEPLQCHGRHLGAASQARHVLVLGASGEDLLLLGWRGGESFNR